MSRFARLGEEAFDRQSELSGEEFRLYAIIVFHTFWEIGICRKNLRQLSKLHRLSYTHTTERYNILQMNFKGFTNEEIQKLTKKIKSPWCEGAKGGIRPLVGVNVPKTGTFDGKIFRKPEHLSSENRNIRVPKTGTFDGKIFRKPELVYKEYKEPLKTRDFKEPTTTEKEVVVVVETNGHQSQFSFEECRQYVAFCVNQGQAVKNPTGLANHLYETGTGDAFISAVLYPEPIETQTIEYDDEFASEAAPPALDESEFDQARQFLKGMVNIGKNLSEFESFYEPSDWRKLVEEIRK